MNNFAEKWKCSNCDTVNEGKRCIVCGQEKINNNLSPQNEGLRFVIQEKNSEAKSNSTRWIIISLSAAIAVLVIVVCVLIVNLSYVGDESPEERLKKPSSEKITESEIEKEKEEEETFLIDSVFEISFAIDVEVDEIEKSPEFGNDSYDNMLYAFPVSFRKTDDGKFIARDRTAYISYEYNKSENGKTTEELQREKKSKYGSNVTYEASGDDWFILSAEIENMIYYEKTIVLNNENATVVFAYPVKYREVYDGYISDIEAGLGFSDTSGIEVIEDSNE